MKSEERTREESGKIKLSVSVDNRVSKVDILSTGGINPFPSEVASFILVQPCKRAITTITKKKEKE